jgi:N-acetylglucosaminyl-diphospho-decaprenol L-rhamnosyltransferase
MTPPDGLTVVVCTRNAGERVARFVAPLAAEVGRLALPAELLVVDNGSADDTARAAEALGPPVRVVAHAADRGLSASRNTAALHAAHPWLLFCDDDLEIDAAAIEALFAARDEQAVVVPELRGADGALQNAMTATWRRLDLKIDYHPRPVAEPAAPVGACFLVGRALFERAGGFDERFGLYYEDVVFGVAVRRAGGRTVMRQGVVAVHQQHGGDRSAERVRRIAWNVFVERWRFAFVALEGRRRAVALAAGLPRTAAQSVRRRTPRPLLAYLRALRDAPRLLEDRSRHDLRARRAETHL